jgi:pimeloyl-ACP methyl ester carboxylesterase
VTPGTSMAPGVVPADASVPSPRVVDVAGVAMSALLAEAAQPRAVVVALHGGAVTSAYFDAPGRPRHSLLRTAAALGFTVIALDRPGYGSSAPHADRMTSAAGRVDLAYAAVDRLLAGRGRGAGVFVVGHSMGCVLAVQMAADERGAGLLGLEIAGIGRHYQPRAAAVLRTRMLGGGMADGPERDWTVSARGDTVRPGDTPDPDGPEPLRTVIAVRDMIWGPDHLYPAGAASGMSAPSPGYEGDEVRRWPHDFPALAPRVRVPVRYSLGDHETVWRSGPAALAEIGALFTASPRVVAEEQTGSGHNLSLGLAAPAYHLKVLSFAEECMLARAKESGGSPSP